MEVIQKQIEHKRPDIIRIYPIGDIHLGSIHCAEHEIERKISEIAKEPSSYIIGMGDYADCILKDDKRFDIGGLSKWADEHNDNLIHWQRKRVKEVFEPVKEKIICLLTGNHEETIHLKYQDDFTRNLCEDLKCKYGGYSCFIILDLERNGRHHGFTIHAWHGSGGSQTEGAKIMRLMRLVNDIQADIYLMGHLHTMAQYTPDRLIYRQGRIKSTKLIATITGSWLKAYTQGVNPSNAETKGYRPTRIGCPCICIQPENGSFRIES